MLSNKPGELYPVDLSVDAPTPNPLPKATTRSRVLRWFLTIGLVALVLAALFADTLTSGVGAAFLLQRFQTFVTIFLGIFIEAAPFLLAGSLVSGLIDVFLDQSLLERYLPKRALPAALAGAMLGMVFPVCECGVVPVARRLYEKGLPSSVGVAFLLAAPVVNPIVIASTYAAFGWGPMLWGRIIFSFLVATVIGLVFHLAKPQDILQPRVKIAHAHTDHDQTAKLGFGTRLHQALNTAGDDFLDVARYLIIGSILAATMQTLVPQTLLLAIGRGPILSVIAMQVLAFVLSVCSTVDAFLALAFSGVFTTGSILTFLTFGPMVDIKSSLMFLGVFQRRVVVYLIVLPLLLTMLIGIFWNLNVGI
jgi:uncharacterized membrane protein YraQ (UPF0718 family)